MFGIQNGAGSTTLRVDETAQLALGTSSTVDGAIAFKNDTNAFTTTFASLTQLIEPLPSQTTPAQ